MTSCVLTIPPASEPVSLDEAKAQCRIDGAQDDALLTRLIVVAREACESYTGRALISQSWTLWRDSFPADGSPLRLPRPPLQSVASVQSYDESDLFVAMIASDYMVDTASTPGRVALRSGRSWPVAGRALHGVRVEFTAGYGTSADAVPAALRQGILAHIAALYEYRGDGLNAQGELASLAALPPLAEALYAPYRIQRL
ncbi:MAG: phage head-tail connector protein [Alphaproteobacteria bacterium]|nr:MAG: phage head-tail connector protein [Alphaproteobacteria bacterium]